MTAIQPAREEDYQEEFGSFFASCEPRLRRALMAAYGPEVGREAAAEALAWAWEHWEKVRTLASPVAYLYRVGQSRSRRRRLRIPFVRGQWSEPWVEPELVNSLRKLSEKQRVALVLILGYGWTLAEVAEVQSVSVSTVQTHLERGLARVRADLEVRDDE